METVEQMRSWLADLGFDEWESLGCDGREDYYAMAWEFWANNAPIDEIKSEYKDIKDHVARYGLDEEGDEDGDD